jgi:two-component sensor histidine kinase
MLLEAAIGDTERSAAEGAQMSELRNLSIDPGRDHSVDPASAVNISICGNSELGSNAACFGGTSATSASESLAPSGGGNMEALLLRESWHRVNNEFASAISLISVMAKRCRSREAKAVLASVEDRLQSYARVQQSLRIPEHDVTIELAAYLDQLCRAISHSKLESRGIDLSLSLHPVQMSAERCRILGMIVFELITNAARHAFDGAKGSIQVELSRRGCSVTCRVSDTGAADTDAVRGTGLRIVEALAGSLHGTFNLQLGPAGSAAIVRFACSP